MTDGPLDEIPLVDLKAQHAEVADEVFAGLRSVMEAAAFILGEEVSRFEHEFARFVGVRHCVGVGNGTDALELILRAVGAGPGDEVVLPANTFVATALAAARAGLSVVLVDCDAEHQLIDVEQALRRIGPRTKAIVPVHLFGQMAPVEELSAGAGGVTIVEDAAQAHGATRWGEPVATVGVAAGVSFYPGKNLGAYGDAGAVVTNDPALADRVRVLRNWGSEEKYHHPEKGFNSRLDTVQAVVLRAKLARLSAWNAARRAAALRYDELLADLEQVRLPSTLEGNEHVWHLYVVRVPERDCVLDCLRQAGIGAGIHYPIPIHLQGAFRDLGHGRGDFPESEAAASEILSLPLHPHITADQQERVADVLRKAVG